MSEAIERMLKNNGFADLKAGASTPCEPSAKLGEGTPLPDYPLRKLVGAALYIGVCGRPDVAY